MWGSGMGRKMWRVLFHPFCLLIAFGAVPAWAVVLPLLVVIPAVEVAARMRRGSRRPLPAAWTPVLVPATKGTTMGTTTMCDVPGCGEKRMLVLERRGGTDLVRASFCEEHALDVEIQARVIEQLDRSRAA